MHKISDKIIAFIPPEDIEPEAMQQIQNTSEMPFLFHHVAVMPDTHYGKGSTVGTVLPTQGAIIPAAVGVDIGCGMIAVRTNIANHLSPEDLHSIRTGIERRVPMSAGKFNQKITETAQKRIEELEKLAIDSGVGIEHYDNISKNWREQLGTLGGGNHFIELCDDGEGTDGFLWMTLHSGSRGIGNKIGNLYIKKAQEVCDSMFVQLKDRDLAYLPVSHPLFKDYLRDLHWAQKFALLNREEMMDRCMAELATQVYGDHTRAAELEIERINCHHNFTRLEEHFGKTVMVTRKGAIAAGLEDRGMIPGSMGTRSYIVKGKAHPASYNSAPHGAGRRMSRAAAAKAFTMEDFDKAMTGIEHRRHEGLIDEIPGAYKDIDAVMENAKELVEIQYVLKQIMNCKGD